jgi:hypothetical protein
MPDQETVFYMAQIVQELCHVMPREAVTYFAEGLRRRHRAIPEDLQRQLDDGNRNQVEIELFWFYVLDATRAKRSFVE